jgi:hypothetical protein
MDFTLTKRGLKPMNSVRSVPDEHKILGDKSWTILLTPSTCISQLEESVGK